MSELVNRTKLTFRYELLRAITAGIIETGNTTFLVLIALEWFHAGATAKGLIASGISIGFLFTPFLVRFLAGTRIEANRAAALISLLGGLAFFVAAAIPTLPFLIGASVLALSCYSLNTPISAHIYQENYPAPQRGRLFSRTISVRILSGLVFAFSVGWMISGRLDLFQVVLLAFGLALIIAAWCYSKIPSTPLPPPERPSFWGAFRYVQTDALFRQTLICWMLLGFGNLMMLPLRVQFLAQDANGFKLSELEITLLVSIIPAIGRFAFSPLWGRLFDRMNFFLMRAAANTCFIVSTISFFSSTTITGLVIGAAIYGVANAGGEIAWNLWVTKLAPAERTADYMSIHTFLTGVRGVIAPIVAFHLAEHYAMGSILWISVALLVLSIAILIPGAERFNVRMSHSVVPETSAEEPPPELT